MLGQTSIFVFCNIAQFGCKKIAKGCCMKLHGLWINVNKTVTVYVLVGVFVEWQLPSNVCRSRQLPLFLIA
jgi:hypothetical protein